jgi:hypothetical protein
MRNVPWLFRWRSRVVVFKPRPLTRDSQIGAKDVPSLPRLSAKRVRGLHCDVPVFAPGANSTFSGGTPHPVASGGGVRSKVASLSNKGDCAAKVTRHGGGEKWRVTLFGCELLAQNYQLFQRSSCLKNVHGGIHPEAGWTTQPRVAAAHPAYPAGVAQGWAGHVQPVPGRSRWRLSLFPGCASATLGCVMKPLRGKAGLFR